MIFATGKDEEKIKHLYFDENDEPIIAEDEEQTIYNLSFNFKGIVSFLRSLFSGK